MDRIWFWYWTKLLISKCHPGSNFGGFGYQHHLFSDKPDFSPVYNLRRSMHGACIKKMPYLLGRGSTLGSNVGKKKTLSASLIAKQPSTILNISWNLHVSLLYNFIFSDLFSQVLLWVTSSLAAYKWCLCFLSCWNIDFQSETQKTQDDKEIWHTEETSPNK